MVDLSAAYTASTIEFLKSIKNYDEQSIYNVGYNIMRDLALYDILLLQNLHGKKIYNSLEDFYAFFYDYISNIYADLDSRVKNNTGWPSINYLDYLSVQNMIDDALTFEKKALNVLADQFIFTELLSLQLIKWIGYGMTGMSEQRAYIEAFEEPCNLTNKSAIINKMILDIHSLTHKRYVILP